MKTNQCPSVFMTRSGCVFCVKKEKHKGDHRGDRKQWNERGQKVPITEPLEVGAS